MIVFSWLHHLHFLCRFQSDVGCVLIVSTKLLVNWVLEELREVADEHGSDDQAVGGKQEGCGVNLHLLGLFGVRDIQVCLKVGDDQVAENSWVYEFDGDGEVALEEQHPPGS